MNDAVRAEGGGVQTSALSPSSTIATSPQDRSHSSPDRSILSPRLQSIQTDIAGQRQDALRQLKRRRIECEREGHVDERYKDFEDGCEGQAVESSVHSPGSESQRYERQPNTKHEDGEEDMQVEPESKIDHSISASAPTKHLPDTRSNVRSKIGINHIDLLYETQRQRMVCRMCM
jgi:hypothetical protein